MVFFYLFLIKLSENSDDLKTLENKTDAKSDNKAESQSSLLDNKSANKSDMKSAQNLNQKPDLPKTNSVKDSLTISGLILVAAGLVTLGYCKFFGKN